MLVTSKPRRGVYLRLALIFAGIAALAGPSLAEASPATPSGRANVANYVEVSGYLDSAAVSFLTRQIADAQSDDSAVVILRLDSPGALDASVDPVLHAMRESSIPVVVWIAPGDAESGGAAALLTLAAHRAVMASEATLGPAHPIDLRSYRGEGEGDDGSTLAAIEDAAEASGRRLDPAAAERLVSVGLTAEEAVDMRMVDGVEPTVQELLQSLMGAEFEVASGTVTLSEEPFTLRFVKMSLLERLTHSAMQPEFAYLLLLVGFFGLVFELYNPGLGAGGIAGAAALAFSFHAFTALPVSWLAVGALVLAFVLLTVDLGAGKLGIVSMLGLAALLAGTLLLYSGAHPAVRLSWWAIVGGILMTFVFFVQAMTSAIKARTAKPLPGAEGILEAVGVARTDIAPDGQVMARGTLWRARTLGAAIGQGTAVKVKGVSGLMLMVEPTDEVPAQSDVDTPVPSEDEAAEPNGR